LAYLAVYPSSFASSPRPLGFFLLFVFLLLNDGYVFFLIPVFYFSRSIPQASFSEFEIDGHFYTSPNQQDAPPTLSVSYSEPLPDDAPPSQLRKRVWALEFFPYLPFLLFSPFHGTMTSRLATPLELIPLVDGKRGYQLPEDAAKSWKTLEQSCRQVAFVLRSVYEAGHPKVFLNCSVPPNPSQFGYLKGYSTEKKARAALSESIDAFVVLFAYVSFCIAICRNKGDPETVDLSLSKQPRWVQKLSHSQSRIHLEFLQLLANSPISDFSTASNRVGAIINVSQCSWLSLVPYMLKANVPIWLYWGNPPVFVQPLDHHALIYAPRSHPNSRAPPLPAITPPQFVGLPTPSQSVGLPTPSMSQSVRLPVRSARGGSGQLPGETWREFMIRQNNRRKEILSKENDVARQAREGRENTAATKSCPGKRGPTVFIWENDGVWTRTLLTRGQVEGYWGRFRSTQKIFNSIDNCWDLCDEFDAGTLGKMYEYDSNDSDNDTYFPKRSPKHGTSCDGSACPPIVVDSESTPDCPPMDVDPTPQISLDPPSKLVEPSDPAPSTPTQISSDPTPVDSESAPDCPPMDVDPTPSQISLDPPSKLVEPSDPTPSTPTQISSDPPPMILDPISSDPSTIVEASDPAPQSVPKPAQVASDYRPMPFDSESPSRGRQSEGDYNGSDDSEGDQDPYEASRQDVFNAHSFPDPDLEQMPVTTVHDLLYYRYGFSLNESPYTGIPSSVPKTETRNIHSWTQACRTVGGQHLEASAAEEVDRRAIQDFLEILAGSDDPFKDVPGKYWDLSPSGLNPMVKLCNASISIEEWQFTDGKHHIIRSRLLHPSRDTSWLLSVDPMTALECVRRSLGPHTLDIADFLISHGVRFRTLQRIPNSLNSEQPPRRRCRYLGNRPANYSFDLADFAGYEALRDSFLRSQSHGPLALREGGIIARLAREVLPNSNALSGPSSEALSGHRARFTYGDEIYVDDNFLKAELELICGTYVLSNASANARGCNEFLSCQLSCN
jgi:hypothetical protein